MHIKIPFFVVRFRSHLSLEEAAAILSQKLFGGIPFGGKEDYLRDEIPTVFIEQRILGGFFILMGGPGKDGYDFEMAPDQPYDPEKPRGYDANIIDYVEWLLRDVKEFEFYRLEPNS